VRTTLTLEDSLAEKLKAEATRTGRPFKAVVNETIRIGLATKARGAAAKPYRARTHDFGEVRPGINLDKALALAAELEDEETVRKLKLGK
jgi:hypothetical protein